MARKAMAAEPTTATTSGLSPETIAGMTNRSSTTKLTARPPSAANPRSRPRTTTATAKTAANHSITGLRFRSAKAYSKPGSASAWRETMMRSPRSNFGVVVLSLAKFNEVELPSSGPCSRRSVMSSQRIPSPGSVPAHGAVPMSVTSAS